MYGGMSEWRESCDSSMQPTCSSTRLAFSHRTISTRISTQRCLSSKKVVSPLYFTPDFFIFLKLFKKQSLQREIRHFFTFSSLVKSNYSMSMAGREWVFLEKGSVGDCCSPHTRNLLLLPVTPDSFALHTSTHADNRTARATATTPCLFFNATTSIIKQSISPVA